ncbi:MAG: winged helix-turn-helix domain-containing protein [Acidobacteriota bacterium]
MTEFLPGSGAPEPGRAKITASRFLLAMALSDVSSSRPVKFGPWCVDPEERILRRDGAVIAVEPKALDVLCVLLARPGRLVTKDEILEAAWPGTLVSENSIARAVAQLRKTLEDDPRRPAIIETVHGHGYRLLPPVTVVDERPAKAVGLRRLLAIAAAGAVILLSLVVFRSARLLEDPAPPAVPSTEARLAVLPLVDLGASDGRLAGAVTEQLTSLLARIDGLTVIPRSTAAALHRGDRRARELGADLGARHLLEGSVQREGDGLRISVQLIDAPREEILWSGEFDRTVDDLFATQSDVALRVAESLRLTLTKSEVHRLRAIPTRSFSAFDYYLRGRELYRQQTRIGNEQAIGQYELALAQDPDFAAAHAGLSNAYAMRAVRYGFGEDAIAAAGASVARALALDPALPEAYKAQGLLHDLAFELDAALAAYRRAIELQPNYQEAIYNAATVAFELGRWAEAVEIQRRAVERPVGRGALAIYLLEIGLDDEGRQLADEVLRQEPLTGYLNRYLALREIRDGELEAARQRLERLRRSDPTWIRLWMTLGDLEWKAGRPAESLAHYRQAAELADEALPEVDLRLALALAGVGDAAASETTRRRAESEIRRQLEDGSQWHGHRAFLAQAAALRGDPEAALQWLERAVALGRRSSRWDRVDPFFAEIAADPRFVALLEGMERDVAGQRQRLRSARAVEAAPTS